MFNILNNKKSSNFYVIFFFFIFLIFTYIFIINNDFFFILNFYIKNFKNSNYVLGFGNYKFNYFLNFNFDISKKITDSVYYKKYLLNNFLDYVLLNSDLDLEIEISTYEWSNILKSEVDNSVTIPIDLAIKYGNEYMGGLINDKISSSRQIYFRGLEQELSFQIPMSGS